MNELVRVFYRIEFKRLTGPGVYIFWSGERALYVGSGKNLLYRCCRSNYPPAYEASKYFDRIEVILCDSVKAARRLEYEKIGTLRPVYNVHVGDLEAIRMAEELGISIQLAHQRIRRFKRGPLSKKKRGIRTSWLSDLAREEGISYGAMYYRIRNARFF